MLRGQSEAHDILYKLKSLFYALYVTPTLKIENYNSQNVQILSDELQGSDYFALFQ